MIHKCCCCTQWLLQRLESRWLNIKSDQHRTLTRIYLPTHTHTSLLENPAPPHSAAHLSCLVVFSVHKQSLLSCCVPELSVPLLSRGLSPAAAVRLCVYRLKALPAEARHSPLSHIPSKMPGFKDRLTRLQKREETGGKHVPALRAVEHFSAQPPPAAKICCPLQ